MVMRVISQSIGSLNLTTMLLRTALKESLKKFLLWTQRVEPLLWVSTEMSV